MSDDVRALRKDGTKLGGEANQPIFCCTSSGIERVKILPVSRVSRQRARPCYVA